MSSLDKVVQGMWKETNNSTFGWDVVVNYQFVQLLVVLLLALIPNFLERKKKDDLLKAAYDRSHHGQLMDMCSFLCNANIRTVTQWDRTRMVSTQS